MPKDPECLIQSSGNYPQKHWSDYGFLAAILFLFLFF